MKMSKLTNGLLVSLLLSASVAGADSKYPATDFQPKVVYQDSDYKHSGSSASTSSSKAVAEVSVADPDYPAANFQPEVLYQDESYKHTKGNIAASSSSTSSSTSDDAGEQSAEADAGDSSMNLILGLGILAIAGFVFYSKNANKTAPAKRKAVAKPVAVVASAGGTVSGVDKYLESKVEATPSGVEKYIEERNTSVSSVSKYVAKQKVTARLAAVTGVDKYLKDRG